MFMHHIIPYYPSKENDKQVPGCIKEKVSRRSASFCHPTVWYPDENNPNYYWLVISTRLKNISQLGWLFPIYGTIKNVPNHQPDYIQGHILIPTKKSCPAMNSFLQPLLDSLQHTFSSTTSDPCWLTPSFFYLTFHDWEFLPQWELGSHHALLSYNSSVALISAFWDEHPSSGWWWKNPWSAALD